MLKVERHGGRTRLLANTLLISVLTLYFCSAILEPSYPWLIWVKSFSEAASVGAIADWFAVTALFRHPLGLPIPHTAIIARQRDRLARGLGEFIDQNFLSQEVLKRKLIEENISLKALEWFSHDSSTAGLPAVVRKLASRSLGLLEDRTFLGLLNREPSALFKNIQLSPFSGKLLRFVVEADTSQEICAGLIIQLKNILNNNREAIEKFVGSKLPWYIPEFVHRPAFRDFLAKVRNEVEAIERNKTHPARQKFRDQLLALATELESSQSLGERGEKLKELILNSPIISQYASLLVRNLYDELKTQIADKESALSKALEQAGVAFTTQLRQDAELQHALNSWLFDILSGLREHSSLSFSSLVQEVFSSWDSRTVVARIEEQVSSDLQFIRINGTVIGGLAGVALHAIQIGVNALWQ